MKRRLIICSSLITIILSCFSFPIFAEETVQDSSNSHTLSDGVFLDSYFYDNYNLLPYIESTGTEYVNTGVNASDSLKIDVSLFNLSEGSIFGAREQAFTEDLSLMYILNNDVYRFIFSRNAATLSINLQPYYIYNISADKNVININGSTNNVPLLEYSSDLPLYLFAVNQQNTAALFGKYRLIKCSIYDYEADNGNGAYVRYYYPAKAKTSGAIGLYDAVSKTFIVSGSNTQFSNPTNEYVENFQISSFLTASLGWIGQIFTAIIDMPIIIVFMAIGLAGVMFR